MTKPPQPFAESLNLQAPNRQQPLAALVRVGLAEFWERMMPGDSELSEQLRQQAARQLNVEVLPNWAQMRDAAAMQFFNLPGPFGHWLREQHIDLPQAFLLAVVGSAETDYLVTLTLSELQAPNPGNRLAVHLALTMLDELFGAGTLDALDLHATLLVQQQVLLLEGSGPLSLRPLRIEPALWSVLCGRPTIWPGCRVVALTDRELLPQRIRKQLPHLATLLAKGEVRGLAIRGNSGCGRRALAAELAGLLGLTAIEVPSDLWQQQPALPLACQLAGWLPVIKVQVAAGESWQLPAIQPNIAHVIVLGMSDAVSGQDLLELEMGVPDEAERRQLWARYLTDAELARRAASALLSGPVIQKVARNAVLRAEQSRSALNAEHIAQARRDLGAERLRLLAEPVRRRVERAAVVFPPLVEQYLHDFIARAHSRESLWEALGVTLQASRNAGLRALFVGDSGTGKTLAASYVATALGAPLYRVDLAAIMNKYVGESEKNLGSLLDLAAAADAILLFDEADSLFGRRTEAQQSGERYANMLTNFLLTRIENHPGITILTTNSRERIDNAFTRRLDAIVDFPMPGFQERLDLWRSHFGQRSPSDDLCKTLASYCDISGGQIRNVVLTAAGCSPADQPIGIETLLSALQREYQKLGRNPPAQLKQLRS
ncbi:ATP-binding protein [Methylomonas sp. EFPC1]|uniref:ATP-binding protein n=1 Tax=Methylomonas sp. EFPC1 TaxID=2812647 RepID=UPI0019670695|nr:ATP-binding protein [Methylomonas sp. EFPC1]QSB00819.1 ATP-binding protein [Methylomonas sp. EFPC1]